MSGSSLKLVNRGAISGISAGIPQEPSPLAGVACGAMAGAALGAGMSMEPPKTFVVHGAEICCSCGSRPSRLVVPASHGVFIHDVPQMNEGDRFPIDNVQVFGLCNNPNNPAVKKAAEEIIDKVKNRERGFMDRVLDFFCGEPELEVNDDLIKQCAALCTPIIKIDWMGGKEDVLIDGKKALLSTCKLSCIYGGEIIIRDDGQRN